MSGWDDSEDYVYTELSPALLDRLLDKNSFLMDKWDKMLAWHRAQLRWYETQHGVIEARKQFSYGGPVGKMKTFSADDPEVQAAKLKVDIAYMQLGVCERRCHALEKEAINLALRNKLLGALYNNGGGSY